MPCSRKRSSRIRQGGSSWQWMAESVDRDDAMPVCFALLCPSRLIRNPIHQAFGRTIMPRMGSWPVADATLPQSRGESVTDSQQTLVPPKDKPYNDQQQEANPTNSNRIPHCADVTSLQSTLHQTVYFSAEQWQCSPPADRNPDGVTMKKVCQLN